HLGLASLYLSQKKHAEAVQECDLAIRHDPGDLAVHLQGARAQCLLAQVAQEAREGQAGTPGRTGRAVSAAPVPGAGIPARPRQAALSRLTNRQTIRPEPRLSR